MKNYAELISKGAGWWRHNRWTMGVPFRPQFTDGKRYNTYYCFIFFKSNLSYTYFDKKHFLTSQSFLEISRYKLINTSFCGYFKPCPNYTYLNTLSFSWGSKYYHLFLFFRIFFLHHTGVTTMNGGLVHMACQWYLIQRVAKKMAARRIESGIKCRFISSLQRWSHANWFEMKQAYLNPCL